MQEHGIDGVQLTQQLQGIWVSARHVSQLELTLILVNITVFIAFKRNSYFVTCLTDLPPLGNLSSICWGRSKQGVTDANTKASASNCD